MHPTTEAAGQRFGEVRVCCCGGNPACAFGLVKLEDKGAVRSGGVVQAYLATVTITLAHSYHASTD